MDHPLASYLRRLELRNTLSPEEREALLAIDAPRVETRSGWDIVRPGQLVEFACLVDGGLVSRAEQFGDGKRQTTAIYVHGDMCDLHSVPVPRAAWAITALTDCAIYQVPHEDLRSVAARFPNIALAFWRDTVVDASVLSKWVSVMGRHPVRKRLAHLLCELGLRMEAAGLGEREKFTLTLTQRQLAEVLGATPVHVYRTFKELKDEGIVDARRGSIRIANLEALLRIAEYDPQYLLF